MRKMMMMMIAAMMMSATAMAQDANEQQGQRPKFDKTEMIQRRTNGFAQRYGLNDKQKTKLLQLNTEYADKLPMMAGSRRGGRRGGQGLGKDSLQARPQRPQNGGQRRADGQRPRPEGVRRDGQRPDMKQMRENMEAYDKQLKKILTDDQYKKYESDRSKMRQTRSQGQADRQKNSEEKD